MKNTIETFLNKINKTNSGCWIWQGCKNKDGYGFFQANKEKLRAHRWSAKYLGNMKIDGLVVCHHCDNPSCVNPNHLFVGTVKDNNKDCQNKGRASGNKNGGKWRHKKCQTPLGIFDNRILAAAAHNITPNAMNYYLRKYPNEYFYV